ncbi:unnamed protein product [Didymodactylos carnosus]|uniref:beta-glucosidase n=1 Tax=Didymodactylos carnosus TaxID=1234261 RepID=A0A8S2WIV7_9BILA|nr:unnamed protein product [Didymodactylos carnosus]
MSRIRMYQDYLPPYQAAVDADVGSVMTSFNEVDRIPASANKWLLDDWTCWRVLEAKYKLGLFDDPCLYCNEDRGATEILTIENRLAAKEISKRSFVLLKNANETLPLNRRGITVALIGPLADDQRNMLGSWSVADGWKQSVSVATGIKNLVGDEVKVVYSKGANIIDDPDILEQLNASGGDIILDDQSPEILIEQTVCETQNADVIVAVLGEPQGMSGEVASRSDIGLPENQKNCYESWLTRENQWC